LAQAILAQAVILARALPAYSTSHSHCPGETAGAMCRFRCSASLLALGIHFYCSCGIKLQAGSDSPRTALIYTGGVGTVTGRFTPAEHRLVEHEGFFGGEKFIPIHITAASIRKHLINKNPGIEVIMHSWMPKLERELRSEFKPVTAAFESNPGEAYFKNVSLPGCKHVPGGCPWIAVSWAYSTKRGVELMLQREIETGVRYTNVMFYRPDVLLFKDIVISNIVKDSRTVYTSSWGKCGDFHHIMARDTAIQFAQFYDVVTTGSSNCSVGCINGKRDDQCWKRSFLEQVGLRTENTDVVVLDGDENAYRGLFQRPVCGLRKRLDELKEFGFRRNDYEDVEPIMNEIPCWKGWYNSHLNEEDLQALGGSQRNNSIYTRRLAESKPGLAVISTFNPTSVFLTTVEKVQAMYPDFDVLIVDSNSSDRSAFQSLRQDVVVAAAPNTNYELGAWHYAYNNRNKDYAVYMFIQDTVLPNKQRVLPLDLETIAPMDAYAYQVDKTARSASAPKCKWSDGGYLSRLNEVYSGTKLDYIAHKDPNDPIVLAAHSSFIARGPLVERVLELEEAYKASHLDKSKKDSLLTERTIGLVLEREATHIHDMKYPYFKKVHGERFRMEDDE